MEKPADGTLLQGLGAREGREREGGKKGGRERYRKGREGENVRKVGMKGEKEGEREGVAAEWRSSRRESGEGEIGINRLGGWMYKL